MENKNNASKLNEEKGKEKSLREYQEENFNKPRKIYDNLNVSVKSLDIFMGVLFVILILALILGTR